MPALMIAEPPAAMAEAAAGLAGIVLAPRVGWSELAMRLDDQPASSLLLIETQGVATPLLDAMLPRLGREADELGLCMVVTLDVTQIDVVAGHLHGDHVILLCEPTLAERVAALSVAARRRTPAMLHEGAGERHAASLEQLNEEVARIAEILARLTRDEAPAPASGVGDRRSGYQAGPAAAAAARVDPQDVRRLIQLRRMRAKFFDPFMEGLFADPAWDMLLDLFAAELEGARVSVSSLCIAAGVAPTTALRWIARMTEIGVFIRHPDPLDRRRAFMTLSSTAADAMRAYMAAIKRLDAA